MEIRKPWLVCAISGLKCKVDVSSVDEVLANILAKLLQETSLLKL